MTDSHDNPVDKLIKMANQIAVGFRLMPEPEAITNTTNHIVAFWTPKMRLELKDYVKSDGSKLEPLARAAAAKL